MAVVPQNPYPRRQSGVILGVRASTDPTFEIETQRSSTGSTWATIDRRQPSAARAIEQVRDVLPPDGQTYSYRARSVRAGYTPSTWTATVSAKPTGLPDSDVQLPKVRATVALSSAVTLGPGVTYTVPWRTEIEDIGSFHSTSVSSGSRLVAPFADDYVATLTLNYSTAYRGSTSAGWSTVVYLRYNGSAMSYGQIYNGTTAGESGTLTLTAPLHMAAAGYADVYISAPSGGLSGSLALTTRSTLTITRVTA